MADETYPGAAPPPPGVTPNLENPGDAGKRLLLAWLVTCNALTLLFFVIRAYSQVWMRHKVLVEDVTCTISWVSIHLYSATTGMMIRYGVGYHIWEVSEHDYSEMRRWLYAGSIIYCPAAYFTKVTLLLVIARVFTVVDRVARAIRVFIFVLLIAYLPIQILKTIICLPIRSFWELSMDGKCLNQTRIFIADIALAILTDIIILVIPVLLLWPLRTSWKKKLKMAVMLGAGGIAVGVTSYRMYVVVAFLKTTDVTSDFVVQNITVMVELTIGLVSSCFPAANMALTRYRAHAASRSSSRSSWTWPSIKRCCEAVSLRTPGTESRGTAASVRPLNNRPAERADPEPWIASEEWDLRRLTPRLGSLTSERGVQEGWLAEGSEDCGSTRALAVNRGGFPGELSWAGGSGLGHQTWDGGESRVDLATALRSKPPD